VPSFKDIALVQHYGSIIKAYPILILEAEEFPLNRFYLQKRVGRNYLVEMA
jgi:hypothetical protein